MIKKNTDHFQQNRKFQRPLKKIRLNKIVTNPENKLSHRNQNNLLVNKQKAVFQFEEPGHFSMLLL